MGIWKITSRLGAWLALAFFISFMPLKISAYTVGQAVVYDQATYVVTSTDNTYNYVTLIGTTKSGAVIIPETFTSGDVTCKVTKVKYQYIDESNGRSCHFNNVTELTLPKSVTYFGTILSSKNLAKVHIPKSCTQIVAPFDNTSWIPEIELESDNPNYELGENGILLHKTASGKNLTAVPSSIQFTNSVFNIPDGVKIIEKAAINGNSSLVTLHISPTFMGIDNSGYPGAITNCSYFTAVTGESEYVKVEDGLLIGSNGELLIYPQGRKAENYKLPDDVKSIENFAFINQSYLKSIDLNNVTTIGRGSAAFFNCSKLTSITIGPNVETIKEGAFESCNALQSYIVDEKNQNFKGDNGVLYTGDGKKLIAYPTNKVGDTYNILEGTEEIGFKAFLGAKNLSLVNIPSSVTKISDWAFRQIGNLEEVNFTSPSNVKTIGTWAFRDCLKLIHFTLPSSLEELKADIFQGCNNLQDINVPDGSQLKTIGNNAFANLKNLQNFNFEGSCTLTTIGSNAFVNCTSLKSFDVPSSVNTISSNAFQGCSSLAKVTFGSNPSIKTIGAGAFANCGLESISIPKSIEKIEEEAFNNCNALTSVDLSANTTNVSPQAFTRCTKLTTFTVDKDNPTYSAVKGYLLSKDKTTLVIFPAGKANDNVTLLPPSLTTIGEYAFFHCDNLTNVVIPQKVTKIGNRAFGYCDNLNYVTFLCDNVIEPGPDFPVDRNSTAFDNGENRDDHYNALSKITISVRKDLEDKYRDDNKIYKQFKGIETSFTSSNDEKDEYMPVSEKSVMLLRANIESTNKTYVISNDVKQRVDSKQIERGSVSMISDYAFEGSSVEEVVVPNTVMYVGAMAFVTKVTRDDASGKVTPNGSTIKDVVFCGDMLPEFQLATQDYELDKNYNEFTADQKIYVRKSQIDKFQAAMPAFSSQITYKIPAAPISYTYGSFAREFDTDFSEFFTEKGSNKQVAAFVAYEAINTYGDGKTYIRMKSIDETSNNTNSDYGYIPANTGVLLKVLNGNSTEKDYWYTIGEKQGTYKDHTIGAKMYGVTKKDLEVKEEKDEYKYVLNKGAFHPIKGTITVPIHKAYLQVDKTDDSDAKIVLVFDDGETTDISNIPDISVVGSGDGKIYNLNGQRVSNPTHGVYLKNGKKYIVK